MIESRAIDSWVRGLDESRAGRVLLAAGIEETPLVDRKPYGFVRSTPIVGWSLDEETFDAVSSQPASRLLRHAPRRECRVAVSGAVTGADVIFRLRNAPAVISAFVDVERPPGSLRRRPWRWPLRIGLLGFDRDASKRLAANAVTGGRLPARLIDVRRIEEEPAAVDLLVTCLELGEATAQVVGTKALANVVILAGGWTERWAVVEAQLATIRGATGAVATVLAPAESPAEALGLLVREMSHAYPLDVAVDMAWDGDALLWAESEVLNRTLLPEMTLHLAREARAAHEVLAEAAPPEAPAAAMTLDRLATTGFTGEAHEATEVAMVGEQLEDALESVEDERWLQTRVNEKRKKLTNRLVPGDNDVQVWVGPPEKEALATGPIDESQLPFAEEDAEAFRLTVVLVPLEPLGEPQTAEIVLPRFGRSDSATFVLKVPEDVSEPAARILVVFRNRILQTALLIGPVGQPAALVAQASLVSGFGALDERRGFDLALLANHDTRGRRALVRHSSPKTWVRRSDNVTPILERIAKQLVRAADLNLKTGLKSKSAGDLLVTLSIHGSDLHKELQGETNLGPIAGATTIQVVTASSDWFLPIELVYEREPPTDGARICEHFLADPSTCGGATCASAASPDVLCPNAFWGLSKTIERHRFDPELDDLLDGKTLLLAQPRAKRRTLAVDHAVLAASTRVRDPDIATARAALDADAETVTSWEEWVDALKGLDTHLLVLLPHTNYDDPSLEISKQKLERGRIAERHVNGERKVEPVVVLFGCRTGVDPGDPGGFAARFMLMKAAVVFHTLTDLKAGHAAEMAERLTTLLRAPERDQRSLSEILTEFRRTAVKDGLLAALAISAYGDADWRL